MPHHDDDARLRHALELARSAIGLSDPNPRVGCVLATRDGRVAGVGHTQEAGGPHAEIVALRQAQAQGHSLQGGTAWVTLEPCSHHGRTPPCCDALVRAGLSRVVVACVDPNPLVAGQGIAALRGAGLQVDFGNAETGREAQELNLGFFSRMLRRRPWVRMKVAASLDGRTALRNGASQWITGEAARADGHAWRCRAGAVLTGIGTVMADDPRLDVRLAPCARQPLRIVVDGTLRIAPDARLLAPPGDVLLATATPDAAKASALRQSGVQVLECADATGRVDLASLIHHLAGLGVNELHVEAGAGLNGALLSAGLVDEIVAYVAPSLIGPGRDLAQIGPLERLDERIALRFMDVARIGDDLRVLARVRDRDAFVPHPHALPEPGRPR